MDGQSRKQAMRDIERLGRPVEGKRDERSRATVARLCVRQRALKELLADSASLLPWVDEELCEKPEVCRDPAEGKSKQLVAFLRNPKTVRIIVQRELLQVRRLGSRHRSETMTLANIVDARDDQLFRELEVASDSLSVLERHPVSI
jgi:hypothetical protein